MKDYLGTEGTKHAFRRKGAKKEKEKEKEVTALEDIESPQVHESTCVMDFTAFLRNEGIRKHLEQAMLMETCLSGIT